MELDAFIDASGSALAVAPLALDAVAACGGTLARLASRAVCVHYLVVYECAALRDRTQRACRVLGIAAENLHHLRMGPTGDTEAAEASMRAMLARLGECVSPTLVLVPSLRSIDPRDAWVARTAAQVLRGRTILSYDRVSRPFNAARVLTVDLDPYQVSVKARAMRPRRLRPGARATGSIRPMIESFEVVEVGPGLQTGLTWAPSDSGPLTARST